MSDLLCITNQSSVYTMPKHFHNFACRCHSYSCRQAIGGHSTGYKVRHVFSGNHESWWRHQMDAFSALLAICAGNSPVNGEFPAQRPVTQSFDVFFYLRLNKRLSKQSWGWWIETLSRPWWHHCNAHDVIQNGRGDLAKSHCALLVIKKTVYLLLKQHPSGEPPSK